MINGRNRILTYFILIHVKTPLFIFVMIIKMKKLIYMSIMLYFLSITKFSYFAIRCSIENYNSETFNDEFKFQIIFLLNFPFINLNDHFLKLLNRLKRQVFKVKAAELWRINCKHFIKSIKN